MLSWSDRGQPHVAPRCQAGAVRVPRRCVPNPYRVLAQCDSVGPGVTVMCYAPDTGALRTHRGLIPERSRTGHGWTGKIHRTDHGAAVDEVLNKRRTVRGYSPPIRLIRSARLSATRCERRLLPGGIC